MSTINYNELKWKFALENSNIGIWDFDASLNRVFYSDESKKIIGFNDDEFGSNPSDWNDRVHPDDKAQYLKDFDDHLNGLKPIYINKHRVLCKDGMYRWILDKGKIIERDNYGKPTRIIGTHSDITQQKEIELEISKSLELIKEQNKKLKNFAHIVTHNLKSHSGNIESLLNFYSEAESLSEREQLIIHLKSVSQSLSQTISNLNEIVSIQANKEDNVKSLNIADYINNSIKLLEVEIIKSKAEIINNVDPLFNLDFNPAYLESIFQNLLSNAIKYRHPDRKPRIIFSSIINKNNLILSIEDNGLGIDLEKFGNVVFNLYRTFHNNKNSEGVGLYLVKNQIESFGGKIELNSQVNVGSTFTITLPFKQ